MSFQTEMIIKAPQACEHKCTVQDAGSRSRPFPPRRIQRRLRLRYPLVYPCLGQVDVHRLMDKAFRQSDVPYRGRGWKRYKNGTGPTWLAVTDVDGRIVGFEPHH